MAPTAHELLRAMASAHADTEAFVDPGAGERLTYGEWDSQADAVAAALRARGVQKGDVVCLILPSCIDYAVVYQAVMRVGAVQR